MRNVSCFHALFIGWISEFAKVLLFFTLTTKYVLQALIVVGTRLQIRSPERTIHCAEVENLQTLILEGL